MKLLVFVLNKEELLDDVLLAFIEAGVSGATVVDSEGIAHLLVTEVPLFMGFKQFMRGSKPYNKTIFSVIEDEHTIDVVIDLIEKICGDLNQQGVGILFTVPIDRVFGLRSGETPDRQEDS